MSVTLPNFSTTAVISGLTKVNQVDEQLNIFMVDAKNYLQDNYLTVSQQLETDVSTSASNAASSASLALSYSNSAAQSLTDAQALLSSITTHIASTSNPHNVTKTQVGLGNVDNTSDSTKNVLSATKWTTARTLSLTGDAIGTSASFDGSGNISISTTLSNSGVTAGIYPKVTVDGKGRVTSGTTLVASDIPNLDWSKITSGKPTTLAGYNIGDAYTKTEVDSLLQGLKTKASVIVATTANITLSGTQTIDGVAVTAGQRVLVKNQTTASQNGIYVCSASAWSRATDADTSTEIMSAYVFVEQGTANQDTAWVMNTDSVVLDTTALTWVKFAGSGAYAATSHTHSAADITSGTLAVTVGGTGTTSSTGTGSVVLSTSPTLVTPNIGVASGTSFNSITGLSSTTPNMDGVASIGTSTTVARADHVHPAQTTITGNAGTATTLQTARTIGASGDVTGTATSFDGSANITIPMTLASVGTAGTYTKVTTDVKGRVISGTTLSASDIPVLDWSKITTGKPTTLDGYGISDATPSSHIGTTGASHGVATTSVNGFMSSADKTKLDGIATNANNYIHPTSGVVAGTYTKITVDSNGHATAGSTPTTLAGYSITDVYTKTEIDTIIGNINSALDTINGEVI